MRSYERPTITLIGGFHIHTNSNCGTRWEWIFCGESRC